MSILKVATIEYVPVDLQTIKVGGTWKHLESFKIEEVVVTKATPKYLTVSCGGREYKCSRGGGDFFGFPTPISEGQVKMYNSWVAEYQAKEVVRQERLETLKSVDFSTLSPANLESLWRVLQIAGKVK